MVRRNTRRSARRDAVHAGNAVAQLIGQRHLGGLIDRQVPRHALDLIGDVALHRVARGDRDGSEQEHDQAGDEAEDHERPSPQHLEQHA